MEHQGENFGFYISDDAPTETQVAMRAMAMQTEHEDIFNKLSAAAEEDELPNLSEEETDRLVIALDSFFKDIDTIFVDALAKDPEGLDVEPFADAELGLRVLWRSVRKLQAVQKKKNVATH